MSISNNWVFALGLFSAGLGIGGYVDHRIMQGRIDKMQAIHAEELRVREVKRAADEKAARDRENGWVQKVSQIEQRRIDETTASSNAANALRERLRNQAASKPANPGRVPQAAAACETTTRGELPDRSREDFISLAERADKLRAGLSACYQAYDSVAR